MNRINRILLMLIAMLVIMSGAVMADRFYQKHEAQKRQQERYSRYEQAQMAVTEMEVVIAELSQNEEAIRIFLTENVPDPSSEGSNTGSNSIQGSITENNISENSISSNNTSGDYISENSLAIFAASEDIIFAGDISGNLAEEAGISGNNAVLDILSNMRSGKLSLEQRRKLQASYMETVSINHQDKKIIAGNTHDFSEVKIACMGDSITAGGNLDSMEDYQQYSYPEQLGEILGVQEVINLGIGGSSIGRYWDQAFVDRYHEIPFDTDIIIVMGGTNDGFCVTEEDIGSLEEREPGTFAGDLSELMTGLKSSYPEATILFATPLPNVLHDILQKDRDYLLPQTRLVEIIDSLAAEYDIHLVDLYNSNLLDSHDAANIYNYIPDGVHCNPGGYEILAQHFAAQIINIYDEGE